MACAGVIVFRRERKECVIVRQNVTSYGFPKGSRERGETVYQGAIRELKEESGLIRDDIKLITSEGKYVTVSEYNRKGNIGVIYLIGEFIGSDTHKLSFDATIDPDINEVSWYTIENALKVLNPKRKDILQQALTKLPE